MRDLLSDLVYRLFSNRLKVVVAIMTVFSAILISRLFVLQIIKGKNYQENYNLKLEKTETIEATRGNIYDRNGELLAYNELSYSVVIEDNGSYKNSKEKNQLLNEELYQIIKHIELNDDAILNDFGIEISNNGNYSFISQGTSLQRFRADVFGHASISDLTYNSKLDLDESTASADQIMEYLCDKRYEISDKYPMEYRYKIAIIRYNISQKSYQKYIATTIAKNVNEKTVAYIKENQNDLTGVSIEETSTRKYVDAECFSSVIGYTGIISTEEYEELKKTDDSVELTDTVGKVGIEKYMNSYLSGKKGYQTIYVDNVGNPIMTSEYVDSISGDDIYLSIDKNLQETAYHVLEKELASIVYSKIENVKTYKSEKASDIIIPIYDVYYAFINNNLININKLNNDNATSVEKRIYTSYSTKKERVLSGLDKQLNSSNPTVYCDLSEEYQGYTTYVVKSLKEQGIFDADKIDTTDEIQKQWSSEKLSVNEYLMYAIEKDWIDVTRINTDSKYSNTQEIYNALVAYVLESFESDSSFDKMVYKYAILEDVISPNDLCAVLYDQGVLEMDEDTRNGLASGSINAYAFVKSKIKSLEITPAMLALDPCSGSFVAIDSKSGEVLACVSYPGYDSNKLSSASDSSYYAYLSTNMSNPFYNYATQQRTAPGSTFKPVSSTAGLAENVITTDEKIDDLGIYENVSNKPRCWIYTSSNTTHGLINVSEALRDSCNYFYYEVGYRLAGSSNYNDAKGIEKIDKYASLYGLDSLTGVEIEENTSKLADEYPVMAAIGQSNHNITTIALARYATALSNKGNVYDLTLLDHVSTPDGTLVEEYSPELKNTVDELNSNEWSAIHTGMRMVVEELGSFSKLNVAVAGKTGTAQQVSNRPNHALFIGFAPYNSPRIAFATRIAYGYTSHNAADVARDIMAVYFEETDLETIMSGGIDSINTTNSMTD